MKPRAILTYDEEMEIRKSLIELECTPKEIEVFVCLCNLGAQPGAVIAKNTNLNRTTTYHLLGKLEEKGFVYASKESSTTFFHLNNISEAVHELEREKRKLRKKRESLFKVSKFLHRHVGEQNLVNMKFREYTGTPELKKLKMKTINPKAQSEVCMITTISPGQCIFKINDHAFLKRYSQQFRKRKIKLRILVMGHPNDLTELDYELIEGTEVKFISNNLSKFKPDLELAILKNMLIVLGSGVFGAIIENSELTKVQQAMFEIVWMVAQPADQFE